MSIDSATERKLQRLIDRAAKRSARSTSRTKRCANSASKVRLRGRLTLTVTRSSTPSRVARGCQPDFLPMTLMRRWSKRWSWQAMADQLPTTASTSTPSALGREAGHVALNRSHAELHSVALLLITPSDRNSTAMPSTSAVYEKRDPRCS